MCSEAILNKRQRVARGLLYAFISPAFAANGYIPVITAYLHLFTLLYEIAVLIDSGIDYRLPPTRAHALYLVDRISYFKQPS